MKAAIYARMSTDKQSTERPAALRSLYLDSDALEGLISRLRAKGCAVTLDQVRDESQSGACAGHAVQRAARGDEEIEALAWQIVEDILRDDIGGDMP